MTITCNTTTTTNTPVASCTPADGQRRQQLADDHLPGADHDDERSGRRVHGLRRELGQQLDHHHLPGADHDDERPGGDLHGRGRKLGEQLDHDHLPGPVTSGPTGVASCTPQAASSGNSYVATTCGTNNTSNVPVQTCTASSATSGNGYTTTTCFNSTTTNVPVAPARLPPPAAPTAGPRSPAPHR